MAQSACYFLERAVVQLADTCYSCSWGSGALFWPPWAPHIHGRRVCAHTHNINTFLKIVLERVLKTYIIWH